MSIADKIWDSIAALLRVNADIARLSAAVTYQQKQIEVLSTRLVRLETAFEITAQRKLPEPKDKE